MNRLKCTSDADLLHLINRVTQASSVGQMHRQTAQYQRLLQSIARRASDICDNGALCA